eukprot:CAMPEP_0177683472 /NCGR_PEP_ID=MMETSP0447-20121125/31823_1 /TAXON_ID=0 /ORGANISM="Stygamoeba regulata, Strain BSH-02190019" /LENGTH=584 /DNA_ID=CAMNT_0019193069 /DNA_START=51 /DNA_END=1801 /DNA_ORIENTATION=-
MSEDEASSRNEPDADASTPSESADKTSSSSSSASASVSASTTTSASSPSPSSSTTLSSPNHEQNKAQKPEESLQDLVDEDVDEDDEDDGDAVDDADIQSDESDDEAKTAAEALLADMFGDDDDNSDDDDLFGDSKQSELDEDTTKRGANGESDGEASTQTEKERERAFEDEELFGHSSGGEGDSSSQRGEHAQSISVSETQELPYEPKIRPPENAILGEAQLPSILNVDPAVYDSEFFRQRVEELRDEDPEALLNLDSVIRWRYSTDGDGNMIKESNARVVRWSDGSVHLFIGKDEVLDVAELPEETPSHLYVSHDGGFIECHGAMQRRLLFRPNQRSMRSQQRVTLQLLRGYQRKKRGTMRVAVDHDPEAAKRRAEEEEQAAIRAQRQAERQRTRLSEHGRMTANYLEEGAEQDDDDYGDEEDYERGFVVRDGDDDEEDELVDSDSDIELSSRRRNAPDEQRIMRAKQQEQLVGSKRKKNRQRIDDAIEIFDEEEDEDEDEDKESGASQASGKPATQKRLAQDDEDDVALDGDADADAGHTADLMDEQVDEDERGSSAAASTSTAEDVPMKKRRVLVDSDEEG